MTKKEFKEYFDMCLPMRNGIMKIGKVSFTDGKIYSPYKNHGMGYWFFNEKDNLNSLWNRAKKMVVLL